MRASVHTSQLRVANRGRLAGLNPDQVAQDLAGHVHGTRRVSEREIQDAVNKAFDSRSAITLHSNIRPATPPTVVDSTKLLNTILE